MKLTYRGIDYDCTPPMLEVTDSEIVCRYRGHAAPYTYVRHVPIPQPAERLTYRGVAYQTTRQGGIQQVAQQPATRPATSGSMLTGLRSKLVGTSPVAQARRELLKASSRLHKENITRSLQHRIEVAKAQGNESLLQQLESEARQTA